MLGRVSVWGQPRALSLSKRLACALRQAQGTSRPQCETHPACCTCRWCSEAGSSQRIIMRKADRMVYEMCELTPEEIAVVEGVG